MDSTTNPDPGASPGAELAELADTLDAALVEWTGSLNLRAGTNVAAVIDHVADRLRHLIPPKMPHTVIGVWLGDEPVPVGTITGNHPVDGGAAAFDRFKQGAWATSVAATDVAAAEAAAVAEMRDTLQRERTNLEVALDLRYGGGHRGGFHTDEHEE